MACFSPMAPLAPRDPPATGTFRNWQEQAHAVWHRQYQVETLTILEDWELQASETGRVDVLCHLVFLGERVVGTEMDPVPWAKFAQGLSSSNEPTEAADAAHPCGGESGAPPAGGEGGAPPVGGGR